MQNHNVQINTNLIITEPRWMFHNLQTWGNPHTYCVVTEKWVLIVTDSGASKQMVKPITNGKKLSQINSCMINININTSISKYNTTNITMYSLPIKYSISSINNCGAR